MLRLVWSDLKKDIAWILVFGLVTALIFISLFIYVNTYDNISATSRVLRRLEEKKAWFPEGYDGMWFDDSLEQKGPKVDSELMEGYLKEKYRADQAGGFSLLIEDRYYFVGSAVQLVSYDYDPADGIRFMAQKRVRNTEGKSVKVNGETYPLDLLPDETVVFTRLGTEKIEDRIVVFCPTYEDFLKVDPDKEAYERVGHRGDYSMIMMGSVLMDPTEEDVQEFHRMCLQGGGYYTTLQSMTQYLSQTDNKGERTHLLYMIFYTVAGIALLTAMVINLVRMLKRKFADYAVHHLYGENYSHIYLRMNLYALGYQSFALFLFLYLTGDNNQLTPWMAVGAVALVILISLIVSWILYREFMENIVIYLRRKEG